MNVNFNLNDFVCRRSINDLKAKGVISLNNLDEYILNKTCTIFNKINDSNDIPVYLFINKDLELSNYLSNFSEYINWLGDCKEDLIKYFNENMKKDAPADSIREFH